MHTDISYKNSPAPKADAINDIKDWLGIEKWNKVSPEMAKVKDPQQFAFLAGIAGIQWFPVEAWYDLYHGEGSYKAAWERFELMEEAAKTESL